VGGHDTDVHQAPADARVGCAARVGGLGRVAGAAGFITAEEKSSGIIDTKELLGDGTLQFDAHVRKAHPDLDRVVEYGQWLRLKVTDWVVATRRDSPPAECWSSPARRRR
jgi:hypothetical protein